MAAKRKRLPSLPPSQTDAELAEWRHLLSHLGDSRPSNNRPLTPEQLRDREGRRTDPAEPLISDDALQTIVAAEPSARERVTANAERAKVPTQLAEAQVGLVARCTACGKPVTGRDVPRDSRGRPRHHRCPL
jgi:hypothetical protein